MNCPGVRLDLLHSGLLSRIVGFLQLSDIEALSCVNKRVRESCLPVLFRAVRFEFSKTALNGLIRLSDSNVRQHIVSLTYVAPEILKTGMSTFSMFSYGRTNIRSEILDLECFRSKLLTPDDYTDWVFGDHNLMSDECPSYMLLYDVLRDMCEEQRDIVENCMDRLALSSIITRLPRLETVNLCFCRTIEEEEWVGSILSHNLTQEGSCEYHSSAIRNAAQVARDSTLFQSFRVFHTELST